MVTEDDKPQSRHGTLRRYRAGCECTKCKAANSAKGKRDRAKAKAKREAAAAETLASNVIELRDRMTVLNGDGGESADDKVLPFSVLTTLSDALDEIEDDDKLTRFYKAQALTLAAVLDNPGQAQLWKGISESLARVLEGLIAAKKPGTVDAAAAIMAAIRGT